MKMHHKTIALSAMALFSTSVLSAQNDPTPRPQPSTPSAAEQSDARTGRGGAESDSLLASWLLIDNNNGIALARIAVQKAKSNEIKQFAQKMVDEHSSFVQKLQPFANVNSKGGRIGEQGNQGNKDRGATEGRNPNESGNSERDAGKTGRDVSVTQRQATEASGARQVASAVGSFDHMALIRDLGTKCLESHTKMLNEKSGADFDRCYLQMQVGAHVKSVDTLEVFRTYASERLRPALDEGLKTVQAHLEHAKTLCKQSENGEKHGGGDGVK